MERITINPDICNGRPTIAGTRITVQTILEFLSAGDSSEAILAEFPGLTQEDIQAALAFASKLLGNQFTLEYAP
jgi:uncharacterized protein (DUF433 family)